MDWWNVLIYGIIPVLTVLVILFSKRKLLWISPLISTTLSFIISIIAMPSAFSNKEYQGFLLWAMILCFIITDIFTVIGYLVIYVLTNKNK